jgi:hypothetical protein
MNRILVFVFALLYTWAVLGFLQDQASRSDSALAPYGRMVNTVVMYFSCQRY